MGVKLGRWYLYELIRVSTLSVNTPLSWELFCCAFLNGSGNVVISGSKLMHRVVLSRGVVILGSILEITNDMIQPNVLQQR